MKSNKLFFAVSAIALASSFSLAHAGTYSLAPAGQGPIDEPARARRSIAAPFALTWHRLVQQVN
jgi:hypothetical protein